jgi:flagellar biosynthesis protein FlhA
VQHLLDTLRQEYPAVVDAVVPDALTLGQVQKVLQNLLAERVPIRDLLTVLETLADASETTKDPDILTEYVRMALRRTISALYTSRDGSVKVITLEASTEELLSKSLQHPQSGWSLAISHEQASELRQKLQPLAERQLAQGETPVVLATPNIRLALRRLLAPALQQVAVVSVNELLPELEVFALHQIGLTHAH